MPNRITDTQIATFKQYWKDGFCLPEIAKMCGSSKSTVRKYLATDIQTYIEEHNAAKEQREQRERIAEIVPVPTTEILVEQDTGLTYEQFVTYAEFELDNCADIDELKELYEQLKADYSQEYRFVIKLRELYEARLTGKHIQPIASVKLTDVEAEYDNQSQDNKAIIRAYRDSLQIKLPIARDANEWERDRLLEHIAYWRKKSEPGVSYKAALHFIETECVTTEQRQAYIDGGKA